MSGRILELKAPPERSLDLGALSPQALAGRSNDAIARLRVPWGKGRAALGDLFEIGGEDGDTLRLVGLDARCHRVGRALERGTIEVSGSVGDELGREMRGGCVRVRGDAGDGAGAGMRGGLLTVTGNAGARAGGLVPGATKGMGGGLLTIGKSAGERAGERMRRGCLLIGGEAGALAGDRMIAGTIAVFGACGAHPGLGMRRGTLLLAHAPVSMTATFNDCGEFDFAFVPLLRDYVAASHKGFARRLAVFSRARRWCGDAAYGGLGEILVAADD